VQEGRTTIVLSTETLFRADWTALSAQLEALMIVCADAPTADAISRAAVGANLKKKLFNPDYSEKINSKLTGIDRPVD